MTSYQRIENLHQ